MLTWTVVPSGKKPPEPQWALQGSYPGKPAHFVIYFNTQMQAQVAADAANADGAIPAC